MGLAQAIRGTLAIEISGLSSRENRSYFQGTDSGGRMGPDVLEYDMATDADEKDRQKLVHVYRERAKALRAQPEIFRSTLLTALVCESVPFGACAESEFFEAVYDDPDGRDYWDAYLSEPMQIGAFAYLLSAHLSIKADQLEAARIAIILALRDATAEGERMFVGDATPLLAFDAKKRDFSELVHVKLRPRRAIDWLLSRPRRENLVPNSLRAFVEGGAPNRRRPLTRRIAASFVSEFVDRKRKSGKEPVLKDLEAEASAAGFHGGRQFLRDAFHRHPHVEVKEGRRKNSPK